MNFWAQLSTRCCTPFRRSLFRMWVSTKKKLHWSWIATRTIDYKMMLLLIKYFHIKQQFKKNICNKTKYYRIFCMQNEQNGSVNMCGNWIINLLISIIHTRPWSLHKMLRRHVLDISFLNSLRDVRPHLLNLKDLFLASLLRLILKIMQPIL
jgi:hypothetical protein